MKKSKRKYKHTENAKIKEVASESADKMRGVDNFVRPIDDQVYVENVSSLIKLPLIFTDGFLDTSLALCFGGCICCLGIIIGLNIR